MAPYRYDHIHFRSEDPLAARAFWEETFGATVVRENLLGGAPSFTFDLNGMRFQVSGMTCDHCVENLTSALATVRSSSSLPGATPASVSPAS